MKLVLLCLTLFIVLHAQERLENSLPGGQWLPLRKDQRLIPRYYICGAEMTQFRYMKKNPEVCNVHCDRKYDRRRAKRRCFWYTACNKEPDSHEWTRSNGIKFRFCHIQKWEDQYTVEEHGNWEWKGLKMCPQNQVVFGYQIKLSERDGVAGLILHCKNPFNTNQKSEILIMDGEGNWTSRLSSGLGSGFRIKQKDGYINGIDFQFLPMPLIYSIEMKYTIPSNLNDAPQTIDSVIVTNNGNTRMKKTIEFTKIREFQRSWQNQRSQLKGFVLSKMYSQSFSMKASSWIGLSVSTTTKRQITTTVSQQDMEKFAFGNTEKVVVGKTERDEVYVMPCTKMSMQLIVYSSYVDIPYVATIAYSNGITNEIDTVQGFFRGVLTSRAETVIDETKVC